MNYKLSKIARTIIIINLILTIIVAGYHGYNAYRLKVSEEIIQQEMREAKVIKDTAIRRLERRGVELFINEEFTTYFGLIISALTLFATYKYARHNSFTFGFFSAFTSLFTSFFGGLLLFYLFFSGKSESDNKSGTNECQDDWEEFIREKSYKDVQEIS